MTAARLVARCIRGLEEVVAAEILALDLGAVTRVEHRAVHFRSAGPRPWATGPSTADDVFVVAARGPDIGPAKAGLARLTDLAAQADLTAPMRMRERRAGPSTGVEVSASFLGRRAFNRYDAEDAVGEVLARRLGTAYCSRRDGRTPPPTHSGWRLTLDGVHATLMLRISARPLHRRPYKRRSIPGTLHPPVAAAMARLADIRPGHTVLDPCCGAGTLLIEAAHHQPQARLHGLDLSPDAVAAARANAAGLPIAVTHGDAARLPFPAGGVDRILCNPPWGARVRPGGLLAASPDRWWRELRRVLAPDGMAVLLLPAPADIAAGIGHGLVPARVQRIRVAGAQPFLACFRAPDRSGGRRPPETAPSRRAAPPAPPGCGTP
ncbi:methyltransferase domain-containing protein [Thermomonospora catenispora]|uniref:methyltransferase domain-containing protein n=1 Tax=Thermomonospora catenispora TaxID=2493090 RepID=UPI0011246268|nr:methyltransferase domain-containing protein [Thermomonospora catenispora]TNY34725.1 methyltransferase domain-containing protein [Thermomonospora catenispora]